MNILKNTLTQTNIIKMVVLSAVLMLFFSFKTANDDDPIYLDPSKSVEARVADLMNRMTLEDKVYQMNQFVGLEHMKKGNPDDDKENNDAQGFYKTLSVNDVSKMCEEGKIGSFLHVLTAKEANYLQELALKSPLKIPVLIGIDAIHGNALVSGTSVYPSPIGLASTWSDDFLYTIGKQTAKEMRATGSHWTFTPNIDILRDPRWGRVGETFGEDPFMVGNMGAAMIQGFQQDDFTGTEKVIACAKHMIGGGESINGLNAAPADISVRTLREVHLPPYKKAIDAGVYSIMAAHNEINGVPSHMSKWLMTDILRNEWEFQGFYVSDWLDIERINTLHHTANDMKQASFLSVDAGMDMHMHGPFFTDAVIASVKEGKLSINRVNDACRKILTAKFKLGLFENRFVDLEKKGELLFTDEHKATALESARKGIVLLKNNGTLPLQKTTSKKKIFVTGPNANNQSILGDWHAVQPDENVITIYEGVKTLGESKGYDVSFFNSGENIRNIKSSKIKEASEIAKSADYAIVVVGDNSMRYKWKDKTAGENMARASLNLFGKQLDLVKAIRDTIVTEYIIQKDDCSMSINGNINPSEELKNRYNLNCERANMYKNYYTYLYGLPMKLKDDGTIIHPKVERKKFQGKEYLVLKATYNKQVGKDTWYFYFNPKTYAMEVYQFFKEKKDSGEYILLSGLEIINDIKMPKNRAWYYNKNDGYLGTDILTSK